MLFQMKLFTYSIPAAAIALLLASCANPNVPNPKQTAALKAVHVNPHKVGSYAHFRAEKAYPRNYGIWKNEAVLARTNSSNSSVKIDLSDQRGYLMNGSELAMDYPVATGKSAHPTPTGNLSHGCIRTYYKVVPIVFDKTRVGTKVSIVR